MCQADFELQFCPLGDLAKRIAKVQIKEIPPPPSPLPPSDPTNRESCH